MSICRAHCVQYLLLIMQVNKSKRYSVVGAHCTVGKTGALYSGGASLKHLQLTWCNFNWRLVNFNLCQNFCEDQTKKMLSRSIVETNAVKFKYSFIQFLLWEEPLLHPQNLSFLAQCNNNLMQCTFRKQNKFFVCFLLNWIRIS